MRSVRVEILLGFLQLGALGCLDRGLIVVEINRLRLEDLVVAITDKAVVGGRKIRARDVAEVTGIGDATAQIVIVDAGGRITALGPSVADGSGRAGVLGQPASTSMRAPLVAARRSF